MTTITEAGHNLAGIQQTLLDERQAHLDEIQRQDAEFAAFLEGMRGRHKARMEVILERIAAIDAIIGSDEAEERKAA